MHAGAAIKRLCEYGGAFRADSGYVKGGELHKISALKVTGRK